MIGTKMIKQAIFVEVNEKDEIKRLGFSVVSSKRMMGYYSLNSIIAGPTTKSPKGKAKWKGKGKGKKKVEASDEELDEETVMTQSGGESEEEDVVVREDP